MQSNKSTSKKPVSSDKPKTPPSTEVAVLSKSTSNVKASSETKKIGDKAGAKLDAKKPKSRWKRRLKRFGIFCLILLALGIATAVGTYAWFAKDLPSTDELETRVISESTKIYDHTGEHLLYETGKDVRRTYTKLEDISPDLQHATIAVEDKNFYHHHGFDPLAIMRSFLVNATSHRQIGGSTITQQFLKLAVLGNERSYSRKIKEVILAVELERKYDKNKILEFYLNEASYGGINLGVAAGAKSYFEKDPKDLTLAQAAFLAAIPQSPSRITQDFEGLLERKDFVLDRMAEEGYITVDQATAAKAEPIEIKKTVVRKDAPHFVDYVLSQLEDDFGANYINQGLRVTTTLDYDKQTKAEEAISNGIGRVEAAGGSNAALVSLDAKTGQVLAMVGSKDYYSEDYDGQVNVVTSLQQPGSSIKPIVYYTAFANGYNPNTILFDVETDFPTASGNYHPRNFSLGTAGPISMRRALATSLNIPAVKTLYLVGVDKAVDVANALGYTTLPDKSEIGLSFALGAEEVRLIDHASAFATFAREGMRHPTASILKVEDRSGNVLYEWTNTESQVLDQAAVQQLNSVLSDTSARGSTFRALNIAGKTIAGKTGTSNEFRDAWTMMYTPSFVVGIWTGNNDNTTMAQNAGADGVSIAAPIANDYMTKILEGLPDEPFTTPPPVQANKGVLWGQVGETTEKYVDKDTGHIIPDDCVDSYPEEFKEKREFKEAHTILHYVRKEDPLGAAPSNPASDAMYASWEKAIQAWASGQPEYISEKTEYEDCNLRSADQTPSLSITYPSSGAELTATTFAAKASINPGTNRTIKRVDYIIDTVTVDSQVSPPFALTYIPTTLTTGRHTLTIRVTNDRDNTSEASVSFSYSTSADPAENENTNTTNNKNNATVNNTNKNNTNKTSNNSNKKNTNKKED